MKRLASVLLVGLVSLVRISIIVVGIDSTSLGVILSLVY